MKKYIVVLDEEQKPEEMFEGEDFLFLVWNDGKIEVHQSDPGNEQRLETAARVLAGAMKKSNSVLTAFVGAITEKAIEQGLEQFMQSLPPEPDAA